MPALANTVGTLNVRGLVHI